jgi:hypothetical protein
MNGQKVSTTMFMQLSRAEPVGAVYNIGRLSLRAWALSESGQLGISQRVCEDCVFAAFSPVPWAGSGVPTGLQNAPQARGQVQSHQGQGPIERFGLCSA